MEYTIDHLLHFMVSKAASDIHLSAGMRPYARIHGRLMPTEFAPLSPEDASEILLGMLTEEQMLRFRAVKTVDFSCTRKDLGSFRINIYMQRGSVAGAIRHLPEAIASFKDLGLPADVLSRFCQRKWGFVLVTGPTGNGKTTTLASMLEYINQTRDCHIITIEDPIEYRHTNKISIIHQREIGVDTPDFATGLKSILREDPDVVVLGEMRDLESIAAAATIAETGHLVFATLHTSDTSESIRRIIDVFPSGQQAQIITQLSAVLCGVVGQTLLPRAGSKGRVVATEVMITTSGIQNIIRENKVEQIYSHIQTGTSAGMHTMNQSLCELVKKGSISRETAVAHSPRVQELLRLLDD